MYTMEYYSSIRKGETLSFETTWMDLENIMLSKISQMEKVKNHIISLMWVIKLKATNEQIRQTNKNSAVSYTHLRAHET